MIWLRERKRKGTEKFADRGSAVEGEQGDIRRNGNQRIGWMYKIRAPRNAGGRKIISH